MRTRINEDWPKLRLSTCQISLTQALFVTVAAGIVYGCLFGCVVQKFASTVNYMIKVTHIFKATHVLTVTDMFTATTAFNSNQQNHIQLLAMWNDLVRDLVFTFSVGAEAEFETEFISFARLVFSLGPSPLLKHGNMFLKQRLNCGLMYA